MPGPGRAGGGGGGRPMPGAGTQEALGRFQTPFFAHLIPFHPGVSGSPTHWVPSEPDRQGRQGRMCVINKVN